MVHAANENADANKKKHPSWEAWDWKKVPVHKRCGRQAVWVHEPVIQIIGQPPDPTFGKGLVVLKVSCSSCQMFLTPEEVQYVDPK